LGGKGHGILRSAILKHAILQQGILKTGAGPGPTMRSRRQRKPPVGGCLFVLLMGLSLAGADLVAIGAQPLQIAEPASFALAISPANLSKGDTVTYTVTASGTGANPAGSFDIRQSGALDDGDFDKTLAAAIAAAPATRGVWFDGANTLTFTSDFAGTFSFSRALTSPPATGAVHQVRLSNPRTVSLIQPTAVALVGSPPLPRYPAIVRGANVSGGEFGTVPGRYATNYIYPSRAEIAYYAERGFSGLRLPFRWERIQHEIYGGLDVVGNGSGDFERVQQVIAWITGHGMVAVIDLHDFGGRKVGRASAKLGTAMLPASALDDLWVRLAKAFKDNDRVWFNLMNEPVGISAARWKMIAQSATNAIRGTGALNRILVPGTAWSGAHSWVSSGNAAQMATFVDAANNYAFDVHQYLDSDNSGTHAACVAGAGSRRLDAFTAWAQGAPGRYGFLGEFAGSDPMVSGQEQCGIELAALLDDAESSGVFIGWTAWGGGRWWNRSYIFRLAPAERGHRDTNYMSILRRHLR
jgi:endoglucanase